MRVVYAWMIPTLNYWFGVRILGSSLIGLVWTHMEKNESIY